MPEISIHVDPSFTVVSRELKGHPSQTIARRAFSPHGLAGFLCLSFMVPLVSLASANSNVTIGGTDHASSQSYGLCRFCV
jgi:hypothetical protein